MWATSSFSKQLNKQSSRPARCSAPAKSISLGSNLCMRNSSTTRARAWPIAMSLYPSKSNLSGFPGFRDRVPSHSLAACVVVSMSLPKLMTAKRAAAHPSSGAQCAAWEIRMVPARRRIRPSATFSSSLV